MEVSLEVESDEDPISKLRFKVDGNVVGVVLRMEEGFVVGSPTGFFVLRPTSLLELPCENSVGRGPVLASVSNVDAVEVILQEVSGHFDSCHLQWGFRGCRGVFDSEQEIVDLKFEYK